jgi:hypothetical protein
VWNNPALHFRYMVIKKNGLSIRVRNARTSRLSNTAARQDLKEIRLRRNLHWQQVKSERSCYHQKRERARMSPQELVTAIIDGMDQKKTDLHGANGKRDRDCNDVFKTRIVGVYMDFCAPTILWRPTCLIRLT